MTADGAAAAVWLPPPGRWQLSRPQRLRLLPSLVRFLGLRTASILGGLERMEARHPHDPSHWYLFILGTEPAAQGRGLGSALLAQVLARVDADRMPAYLESSSQRNLALYGRHGFEITSEVAIPGGPGSGPCGASPALERVLTWCLSSSRRTVIHRDVVDLSVLDGYTPKAWPLRRQRVVRSRPTSFQATSMVSVVEQPESSAHRLGGPARMCRPRPGGWTVRRLFPRGVPRPARGSRLLGSGGGRRGSSGRAACLPWPSGTRLGETCRISATSAARR
jgi:GNAT superfamily N-acetyltransferase